MPPTVAAAAVTEPTTIFDWSAPRSRRFSLLSFIAASLVLHALCFYIFQIIYPPAAPPLPPPARVSIITPESEEGRVLLRWIEAEDPALSSTTQLPPGASEILPPKPAYVASFANRQPALKQPSPFEPDLRVPTSRPPGPVPRPSVPVTFGRVNVATHLIFADEATLGAAQLPPLQFTAKSDLTPQAAQFRIGLNSLGEVRYCFMEESSGDSALDEQAHHALLLTRFPAVANRHAINANAFTWTTVAIEWGNDLAPTSPPSPSQTPAP